MLINGQGNVNCPGVPFLMSLIPPPLLPVLGGQNLTDKGCIPVTDLIAQTTFPHDFNEVPFGLFEGCNASDPNPYMFNVDPREGWVSLNLISTASLQEMTGKYRIDVEIWCFTKESFSLH